MAEVTLRRVREVVGARKINPTFLVDRLWPRGVGKQALDIDGWLRDVAPSTELRKLFRHDPSRWDEFSTRYRSELAANEDAVRPLQEAVAAGPVTLLYDARDEQHNQAVVLRDWLLSADRP
jgi:uncharacterized protein YeaO (DUF488 family)